MTPLRPDEHAQTLGIRRPTFHAVHAGAESCRNVMSRRFSIESRQGRGADRSRTVAKNSRQHAEDRRHLNGGGSLHPLVDAKLAVPSLRRGVGDRARVGQALGHGVDAALTLVVAPAGYGKTTAVRAWCASRDAALAWVTLDAGDNDPVLLWRYVATAVDRVRSGVGRGALRRLGVAGGSVEVAVDELMNGAGALGCELVVVLDDVDAVISGECLSSIEYALGHLPTNVHVVLVARVDPVLRLARLRAAGEVVEVRGDELAFTAGEARELLVVLGGLALGGEEIEILVERTEGWPAALALAWLWLRTAEDPAGAVRAFGGDNRFVADYLSGEVLAALDEDGRAFLYGVAVLGEFTAELCDSVLDRGDSAVRLVELERSNLFVSRLERGGWFRIHSLFAEYAITQLASLEPGAAALIHRRAAVWLRSQGLVVEAVRHAAAAGDHELVAELLVKHHLAMIRGGAGRTVLRWVRMLPADELMQHPELAAAGAAAAMLVGGHRLEQRRLLALADAARAAQPERGGAYVEAVAALVRAVTIDRGVGQAVLDGQRAVELAEVDPQANEIITGALVAYARALFFAGQLDEASAMAVRALEHPAIERDVPSLVVAYSTLAFAAAESGRLGSARGHAEEAKAGVGRIGTSHSWLGAHASAALGVVLAGEGTLVEADQELAAAERFFADAVATPHHTWLLVLLARVRTRRGRLAEAEATLRSAREAVAELIDAGTVPALADAVERELEAASDRASSGELLEPPSDAELPVLRLLATDLSVSEISTRLFLSQNTIRSHTRALYRKLEVHTRADAIARASALGLMEQTQSPM
jgi:LuxR family maltose regulon positive regulatory protein